jgi:hypothetical protein
MLEPDALHCIAEAYVATRADLIVGGCVRFGETRSDEFRRHHASVVIGQKVPFEALDVLRFILSWEKANYFYQPEVFFSRRIWYAAGGYIKNHLYCVMDYDLWFRMALAGASIYHVPAIAVAVSTRDSNARKRGVSSGASAHGRISGSFLLF